jgi:hypothetical protein
MFPWWLVHLIAIPLALRALKRSSPGQLLATLYLAWLLQAVLLQHLWDYVQVPTILLGIAVVCCHVGTTEVGTAATWLAAGMVLLVALPLPGLTAKRLAVWDRCFRECSSAVLRDRLSLLPRESWAELDRVRAFLAEQGVGDGELTCFTMRTVPLYLELKLQPSTRFFLVQNCLFNCPPQRATICADLAASRQRLVVCDVTATYWKGVPRGSCEIEDAHIPKDQLLFQAGRYAVYAIDAPAMPAWIDKYIDL